MGRRLPDYDPQRDGDYATSKRRIQVFKRVYQHYHHWRSLREAGQVDDVLSVDGEDIYIGDLMTGIDTLPLRQRQAFELICLQGYTESAATAILLPHSRWSTPVQQYSDDGLKKMVSAYDAKQNKTWDPTTRKVRKSCVRHAEALEPVEASSTTDNRYPDDRLKSVEHADTTDESGEQGV